MIYPNLFKSRYPELKGQNWIKDISAEDRQAFSRIGFEHSNYGRNGGNARAKSAKRIPAGNGRESGRFCKG